jgi:signal transduction histidine kinase
MTPDGGLPRRGRAAAAARPGMLLLALATAVLLALSFPAAQRQRSTVCAADCPPNVLTAGEVDGLSALGLSPQGYVAAGLVLAGILSATYLVVAVLLLRMPGHGPEAVLAAGALTAVALVFPQTMPSLATGSGGWGVAVALLETIATTILLCWVLTYPDGRFRPRWSAALVAAVSVSGLATTFGWSLPPGVGAVGAALTLGTVAVLVVHRHRRLPSTDRTAGRWVAVSFTTALAALVLASIAQQGLGVRPGTYADLLVQVGIVAAFLVPPVAVAGAVVRRGLLDVGSQLSRAVSALVAGAGGVCAYLLLVALGAALPLEPAAVSLGAVGLVTTAIVPLHSRLRRRVNRALYGMREDPAALLAALAGQASAQPALEAAVVILREALLVPAVVIETDGRIGACSGEVPPGWPWQRIALLHEGETVGVVALAVRDPGLSVAADLEAVAPVLSHLAVLVHAVRLTDHLTRAQEQLVGAREEERRRVRDELHDGLGPTLSAVRLSLAAAVNLLEADPARARELVGSAGAQVGDAVVDVRRLVYGLRPPGLDERGLRGAIDAYLRGLTTPLELTVTEGTRTEDGATAPLPAAVEVAAYRIVLEAVTNAVRHSGGSRCDVLLGRESGALVLRVSDDGTAPHRSEGVGVMSMRARAAELGGTVRVETDRGTTVTAVLPLGTAGAPPLTRPAGAIGVPRG